MKTISPADVRMADYIRSCDRVLVSHSTAEPVTLLEMLVAQRAEYRGARLFMHVSFSGVVRPEHADSLVIEGLGAVGTQRYLCKAGVLDILPSHLSDLPYLFDSGELRVDVALVQVSAPDAEGRYSLGLVNDYQVAGLRRGRVVMAQQNDQVPFTQSEPFLTAQDIDVLVPASRPMIEVPSARVGELEARIASHAARYLKNGAIVQFGIGAIPDAIAATMVDLRNLGIHSGVISDSYLALAEAGAITNATKKIDVGQTVTGAIWGTKKLYDFVNGNRSIKVCPLTYTHAPSAFASLPGYVSLNSAIEIDLSGQANLEVADGAYIGAVGGSVDFIRGSRLAHGGRSIIALPATAAGGRKSRIVANISGVVTVARSDVDVIITEYGAAELRGKTLRERARQLIAIAHPDFRDELARAASLSPDA
jgi:acyl-CoA hydrolase